MPTAAQIGFQRIPIGMLMLASMLIWSLLIGFSLTWNIIQIEEQTEYLATKEARANWNKDEAFRLWATRHGGLYTKPDARTSPNPYLAHLPNRDVETTDGMKLTLMNPAYMIRQMSKEFEEIYGVKGKITGRQLLNPINKADSWELEALKQFNQGANEVIEVTEMNDEPHLRLMRPIIMREGCVKCHGHLGFNVGDIRGGVSVSIPLAPYQAASMKTIWAIAAPHGGVWLLGLMGITFMVKRGKRFEIERTRYEQAIKNIATVVSTTTGDACFRQLVEHMAAIFNTDHAFIGVLNKDNPEKVNTLAISSHGKIVDNIEYSLKDTPCRNVINHGICTYPDSVQQQFPKDKLLLDMSAESFIGKPLLGKHGETLGIMVVLDSKPLQHTEEAAELLEIFAARATGEIERLAAEQTLRRSQKMETIGQLSGGIAHDFNNQLGIILGYLDFLKDYTANDARSNAARATKWVEVSTNATLRCMDLTRQLLSFSRTQPHEKTMVDINAKLNELQMMFARSVTPAIEIQYLLAVSLWLTEIDPGEFQDTVLNLVLNARDAMPGGGKLLIETSNKTLDAGYAALNPEARAGDYVELLLSDNGSGMDKASQEHIFEPFYTTKPKDKGTGLGMSMVYGFIKRCGGFIKIYSEVNIGTTMQLYLPRTTATKADTLSEQMDEGLFPLGNETVLIVDDEIDLLHLANKYLNELGYQTYLAENASQALEILAKQKNIDCLFSDVVMPGGINGYELAQQATTLNPELKVLMTSGFISETITQNGRPRLSISMLNKPYRKIELAQRIRQVLDENKEMNTGE